MRISSRSTVAALSLLTVTAVSCGSNESESATTGSAGVTGNVTVFAAASLTAAFTEIGEAFTAEHPDADVAFNFAASSELAAQIGEGAPADVFASADIGNMTKLTDAGATSTDPVVFAGNVLQIIVAPGNPLGISGVADLADADLIVVTCAPEVPCGKYAAQVFEDAGVAVTPKSLEENVKAVVTKVTLGEADAGIVYRTDVVAAGDAAAGVEIPADLNVLAEYPIAVTEQAPNAVGAQAFIDFVLGATGQRILASYGFLAP